MQIRADIRGLDGVMATLRRMSQRGIPQALARGLNRTTLAIERREKVAMSQQLDRPTPYTLNSLKRWQAKPNRLRSGVFIMRRQAAYLRYAIEGGNRSKLIVPVVSNISLDAHGNIRGKRAGLRGIAKKSRNRFIATIGGRTGIWQRTGRGGSRIKLLAYVAGNVHLQKRYDFDGVARAVIDDRLKRDIVNSLMESGIS